MATNYNDLADGAMIGASIAIDLASGDPAGALKTSMETSVGLLLTGLGIAESDPDLSGQLEDITNQLSQINNSLKVINGQLTQIQKQLEHIIIQLNNAQGTALYQTWLQLNTEVLQYVTLIGTMEENSISIASNPSDPNWNELAEAQVADILSSNGGALYCLNQINALIMGVNQQESVLTAYVDLLQWMNKNGGFYYRSCVSAYFEYYIYISANQMSAVRLEMDAYSYNENYGNASTAFNNYQPKMLGQEVPFLQGLEIIFNFETYPYYTNSSLDSKINAQYAQGYTNYKFQVYFQPMFERYTAEKILGYIQSLNGDEQRISLSLITPTSFNYPKDQIQLKCLETGKYYSSSSNAVIGYIGPNKYLTTTRFLFTGLPSGTYALKDVNGENSFPSGSTYQPQQNFYAPRYLNYQMGLSISEKFNFMDVMSYAAPCTMPAQILSRLS